MTPIVTNYGITLFRFSSSKINSKLNVTSNENTVQNFRDSEQY